jgi:nitrite reductase/ring-hydroxylating ferredoxin subunit
MSTEEIVEDQKLFCDWCGREYDMDDGEWGPHGTYCSGHCFRQAQNNTKIEMYRGNIEEEEEQ